MATRKKSKPSRRSAPKDRTKTTSNYCSLVEVPPKTFGPEVSRARAEMIIITNRKWVNGTKLKYYFFSGNDGSPASWKGPLKLIFSGRLIRHASHSANISNRAASG